MAYYEFTLKAGVPLRSNVAGRFILVDSLGAAPGLDIQPFYGGRDLPKMPDRKKAFKMEEPYDGVILTAPVDCTVALFLTVADVSLGFADGSLVNVNGSVNITNGDGQRVPVDVGGSNITVTADNVGVNNTTANPVPVKVQPGQGATLAHVNAVAVNTGAAQSVMVANPARMGARFRNASTNGAQIALGGAGVTMANAAIILKPGETWTETEAAAANWFAATDINGAEVRVMGVAA